LLSALLPNFDFNSAKHKDTQLGDPPKKTCKTAKALIEVAGSEERFTFWHEM